VKTKIRKCVRAKTPKTIKKLLEEQSTVINLLDSQEKWQVVCIGDARKVCQEAEKRGYDAGYSAAIKDTIVDEMGLAYYNKHFKKGTVHGQLRTRSR
jgi:glycerate-2-kinase